MTASPDGAPRRSPFLRFVPIAFILLGIVAFFAFGLGRYVSCDALRDNQSALLNWVSQHGLLAPIVFTLLYATITALSLPVASLITVVGGFIFGGIIGTVLVVIGATAGGVMVFLAARTALAGSLRARAGSQLQKMQSGFAKNAVNYLLFLRLVPLFPFWLVNLAPALLGVPLWTFLWTTLLGIIPGTAVYVYLGSSVGGIVETGSKCTPSGPALTRAFVALALLGCLSLVPMLYRKFRGAHG
jgi:uncharacterized membrane protein YdjX (TVP38/TMEM64 family)